MEKLPLELRQHIFAYLLPRYDSKLLTTVPTSTRDERNSVYHLRLTSRRTCEGASQVFTRIVADIPTECATPGLRRLEQLVQRPLVTNNLTCLTFRAYWPPESGKDMMEQMENFGKVGSPEEMTKQLHLIFQKAPRLRHLICTLDKTRPKLPVTGHFMSYSVDAMIAPLRDEEFYNDSFHKSLYVRHLTVAPSNREMTAFRLRTTHLTSLHIVLDYHFEEMSAMNSYGTFSTELCPGLRDYIISGTRGLVATETLLDFISPVFERYRTLPLMTIRNMTTVVDISYDVPQFNGDGRIGLLVFDNFKYCLTDEITLDGPSEPRTLNDGWRLLNALLKHADDWVKRLDTCDIIRFGRNAGSVRGFCGL
ncbi:hypothetical protein EK21DRAFT_94546 [Setomelanomma holmii]|uniref:Uncharacterized protein n=1 Tax=Setomelanomma holmii TaxID=210430 RepID=A0A9P4LG63_9PLEO|nr:hypothetical protein EK21DRAFT_94546 [Setomelanomma holmii]